MIPFGIMTATTDHGGIVMATQQQVVANGMAFLRAGDGFVCPKCRVWSTLVISNQNIIMFGKPVAFAGDKFTCGATLMPNQSLVGGDKGQSSCDVSTTSNNKNVVPEQYDHQFLLKDRYGHPLTNTSYTMKSPSGDLIHSETDNSGKTRRYKTNSAQNIEIHKGHIQD